MNENQKLQQILNFVQAAEKLKTELRHSWTSDINRQESVAEHTWLMSLLALLFLLKDSNYKYKVQFLHQQ